MTGWRERIPSAGLTIEEQAALAALAAETSGAEFEAILAAVETDPAMVWRVMIADELFAAASRHFGVSKDAVAAAFDNFPVEDFLPALDTPAGFTALVAYAGAALGKPVSPFTVATH